MQHVAQSIQAKNIYFRILAYFFKNIHTYIHTGMHISTSFLYPNSMCEKNNCVKDALCLSSDIFSSFKLSSMKPMLHSGEDNKILCVLEL